MLKLNTSCMSFYNFIVKIKLQFASALQSKYVEIIPVSVIITVG